MKNISVLQIVLIVMMVITIGLVGAAVATGSEVIVGYNLIWAYILLGVALGSAVFCAILGMIKDTEGLVQTAISTVIGAIVIVASYLVASGHSIQIVDLGSGGFFEATETIISEASIYVTYIVLGAAILATIGGIIFNFVEGFGKGGLLQEDEDVAVEETK